MTWRREEDGYYVVEVASGAVFRAKKLCLSVGAWAPLVWGMEVPTVPLSVERRAVHWFDHTSAEPSVSAAAAATTEAATEAASDEAGGKADEKFDDIPVYIWERAPGEPEIYGFPAQKGDPGGAKVRRTKGVGCHSGTLRKGAVGIAHWLPSFPFPLSHPPLTQTPLPVLSVNPFMARAPVCFCCFFSACEVAFHGGLGTGPRLAKPEDLHVGSSPAEVAVAAATGARTTTNLHHLRRRRHHHRRVHLYQPATRAQRCCRRLFTPHAPCLTEAPSHACL